MRVLVAEDDSSVSHWLGCKLQVSGYQCTLVDDGEAALDSILHQAYDVMILDRMLPKMDGMQLLQNLRGKQHPPIIVLSALDQPSDRVEALRAGADDYLGKPFDFTELVARIEALIRRIAWTGKVNHVLMAGEIRMEVIDRLVYKGEEVMELTDKEYKLLQVLLEHKGQIVTRGMLLEKVWGYEFDPQTNLIDVHISKLRNKLGKGHNVPALRTIRSVGYALD